VIPALHYRTVVDELVGILRGNIGNNGDVMTHERKRKGTTALFPVYSSKFGCSKATLSPGSNIYSILI
jgi:hypothetical protein